MPLALAGFAMVVAFMALIMTKRLAAVPALILVPIVFAVILGLAPQTGAMMMKGVEQTAPTAVLLVFAILYFGLMIDAGLFQPLVRRIVAWAGDSPLRVTLGHTALAAVVALDGDGTTTVLVCASAMLPVYRRLGMNVLIFAVLGGMCATLMNLSPWGGPAARVAAALKISPADLFFPLLPVIGAGLAATFLLAWFFGARETRRLAGRDVQTPAEAAPDDQSIASAFESDPAALRPRLVWANLALTAVLMAAVVLHLAPLQALFMTATAIALVINYPKLADQRARLMAHAGSVLSVAIMVLAAGAFTGVLSGAGMVDAMAASVIAVLPPELGPHLGAITALLSMPMTFFLSNDAFYFGVLPVIAEAARAYGVTPEEIGRASLLGQPVHGLSPLVAAVYLKCAILNVELADLQRFAFKYAVGISLVTIAAALVIGAVPWIGG